MQFQQRFLVVLLINLTKILPAVFNYSVRLFGNILHIFCCHLPGPLSVDTSNTCHKAVLASYYPLLVFAVDCFGIVGVRTVYELQGICCYPLEHNPPAQKSIIVSRMFGEPIENIEQLKEAIAAYAARAGEKLRQQKLAAGAMSVFVTTSRFIKNRYFNSHTTEFAVSTSDTTELIRAAVSSIDKLYRRNFQFKKCGVILTGLVPESRMQRGLFDNGEREKSARLMRTIDAINAKVSSPVRWAVEGINRPWEVKFKRRSKRYTTRWDELPVVA